jgi:hemolysin activation/secretion protein
VYRERREDEPFGKAWAKVRDAGGPWELLTGVSLLIDRIDDALDGFELLARGLDPDPKLWTSFLAEPGEIVEIDRVQHGVDQLNRVASHHAAVKLEPGTRPATSVIAVENTAGDSFRVNAGYELNGSDLNGTGNTVPARLRLDVAKDNLVGISDAWRASYASGLDSNEVRAGFTAPFRRFLIFLDAGYSESLAEVAPGVEMFTRDANASASLSYLLDRDRSRQTNLEASLSWRTGERFIEGVSLAPQVAAPVRIGFSESRAFGDTVKVSYGAGVSKGLNAFGATHDAAAIEPTAPRAQFVKVDGQVGFAKAIEGIGAARLDVNAQWSERPLYSDDQLVLGSVSTVRGFTNSAQRVDRGVVARAEFQPELRLASWLGDARERLTYLDEALSGLQPYLFSDYGAGRDLANREILERASIGAGLRYRHGRVNLDVSVGEPVFRSGGTKVKAWQAPEAYLTLSVRLL